MKKAKIISLLLVLVLVVALCAACGSTGTSGDNSGSTSTSSDTGSKGTEKAPSDTVKIGIVNPTTGPLSGFGEGCPWTENLVVDYVNNELGGLSFADYGDTKLPIEIIVYDSQSDTTVCSEMAQKLIEEDGVNMLIARHTPDTVNPVCAVAERYGVVCVSIECPLDAWLAEGAHTYSEHSMWNLDMIVKTYISMFTTAGYAPSKDIKIGFMFPNDSDGTAWANKWTTAAADAGYTVVDPGRFPTTTTDYSDLINEFKSEGVQILIGCMTCPTFGSFWLQCSQMGFEPPVVSVGKAYLLEADAMSIGADLMDGLLTEIWWSPDHPYKSSLTGMTPSELAAEYKDATGRNITQPMGYKYASMEIAVGILQGSKSLDPEDLMASRDAMDIETIIGNVKYDQTDANGSKYAITPVCGGQWQLQDDGSLKLVIIDNSLYPEIPITGEYKARLG